MKPQIFKPFTPDNISDKFCKLPENDRNDYSALFDGMMNNVCLLLKEHCDKEAFDKVWTCSLFPERISQAALRLFEEHLSKTKD